MTEFTLAPPQSAETVAGFRDGQPWLVIEPATVRECRHQYRDDSWAEWGPICTGVTPHSHDDWDDIQVRERTVPVQVPDPVPCPECLPPRGDGKGWWWCDIDDSEHIRQQCSCGSGSVQRPLLVPTWQCRTLNRQTGDGFIWTHKLPYSDTVEDYAQSERRLAGVVLHPNPVYLPVVDDMRGMEWPGGEFVERIDNHPDGPKLYHWWGPHSGDMADITDQFSTPPPVGALLVDMTGAVWLEGDDVVTEMCDWRTDEEGQEVDLHWVPVPLSASTTLTTIEVP